MIDSCTSSGVDRKRAMYAPEMLRTMRFLLSRISASSSAGMMASRTDTTASSSVYSSPRTNDVAYLGRKEKLKKFALFMSTNRLLHHIEYGSFLCCGKPYFIWL